MAIVIDYSRDIVHEIDVDLHGKTFLSTVETKQYDDKARYIVARVWDDGEPYVIPAGTTVMFRAKKPDGFGVANMCEVIDGKIVYQITLQTTIFAGEFEAEFGLYNTVNGEAKAYSTPTFKIVVGKSALPDDTILSTDEVNVLTKLIADASTAIAKMNDIANAESTRVSNENARKTSETARVSAENTRVSQENTRKSQETSRVTAESNRATAETGRANAESTRVTDENTRKTAESTRVSDENTRKLNETTRQNQETARQNFYNAYKVYETYSSTKAYVVQNKVTYQGGSYICIANTTGNAPAYNTDNTWWKCIGAKGQDGTGTGDMLANIYDTNNRREDVFNLVDQKASYKDVDTQTGTFITSTKAEDALAQMDVLGTTLVTPTNPDLAISPDNPATLVSALNFDLVSTGKNVIDYKPIAWHINVGSCTWEKLDNNNTLSIVPIKYNWAVGVYRTNMLDSYVGKTLTISADVEFSTMNFKLFQLMGVNINKSEFSPNVKKRVSVTRTIVHPTITIYIDNMGAESLDLQLKISNIQIELGSVATPYSPYKEDRINIPLDMGEWNEIKDGQYVKGAETVVFDGSADELWNPNTGWTQNNTITFYTVLANSKYTDFTNCICDKFKTDKNLGTVDYECCRGTSSSGAFYIRILKSRLSSLDEVGVKAWLASNPITVRYQLATPIVTPLNTYLKTFAKETNIYTTATPQPELTATYKSQLWADSYLKDKAIESKFDTNKISKTFLSTDWGTVAAAPLVTQLKNEFDAANNNLKKLNLPSSKIAIVSKDGMGYNSIGAAINGEYKTGQELTVLIYPGIYEEIVDIHGKLINLIGYDKDKCIIQTSGDWTAPPVICSGGGNYIANLTIRAYYDSRYTYSRLAYCIHCDYSQSGTTEIFNCDLINEQGGACAGIGLHSDQHLKFKNCNMITKNNSPTSSLEEYTHGCLYGHNNDNAAVNQKLTVESCFMLAEHGSPIYFFDVNWQHPTGHRNDNKDTSLLFMNNILYSLESGIPTVIAPENLYPPLDTESISGYLKLNPASYGNNANVLNNNEFIAYESVVGGTGSYLIKDISTAKYLVAETYIADHQYTDTCIIPITSIVYNNSNPQFYNYKQELSATDAYYSIKYSFVDKTHLYISAKAIGTAWNGLSVTLKIRCVL